MTAVEWFAKRISHGGLVSKKQFNELLELAKEIENEQSQKYAEFAIRCDRMDMRILNFDDYMKLDVVTEYRDGTIERDESNN
jgi:THUMP domain